MLYNTHKGQSTIGTQDPVQGKALYQQKKLYIKIIYGII